MYLLWQGTRIYSMRGHRGLAGAKNILNLDLRRLILEHARVHESDLSLLSFKRSWKGWSLSFIHNCRLLEHSVGRHIQNLYDAAMSHVFRNGASLEERVAGLFAIYFVYFTQHTTPRVRIQLSRTHLEGISSFIRHLKKLSRGEDAIFVVKLLSQEDAFTMGMLIRKEINVVSFKQQDAILERTHKQMITARKDKVSRVHKVASHIIVNGLSTGSSRVKNASRIGLDRMRNTRIPNTFPHICKASEAYLEIWRSLKDANLKHLQADLESSDRTKGVHQVIARQLIKNDEKLPFLLK